MEKLIDALQAQIDDLDERLQYQVATTQALESAILAILGALDDTLPAVRDIAAQTIQENLTRIADLTDRGVFDEDSPEFDALCDLGAKIALDGQLVPKT